MRIQQKRGNALKIKYVSCFGIVALSLLLAGCGNNKTEESTQVGMQAIAEHEYDDALQAFQIAEEKKENPQMIARGRGIASVGLTDYTAAVTYFKEALSYSDVWVDELDYDINFYLAEAYKKSGDYNKSIETYSAILDMQPKNVTAYYQRGCGYLMNDMHDKAIQDFDKALNLDKDNYDLRIEVAGQLSEAGYDTEGKQYLSEFLKDKQEKLSDFDTGRIYFYLQDYENAKVCFEKARDDENQNVILFLGKTYEQLGDYNYAASTYQNYLNKHQDAAVIYNQLGLCKLQSGDYEGAKVSFSTALAIENNGMEQTLEFNQIVATEYVGDFKQASILMEAYCKKYPDDQMAVRENIFLKTR